VSAGFNQVLSGAAKAGVEELRLAPGRRVVWVRRGVESEVGEAQSRERIDEIVDGFLTSAARMDLALGAAEWSMSVPGLGPVLIRAELKNGATHATFFLEVNSNVGISMPPSLGGGPAGPPAAARPVAARPKQRAEHPPPAKAPKEAGPAPVAPGKGGSAKEINQLLIAAAQLRASDLHLSAGVTPMVRVDGDMRPMSGRAPLSSAALEQVIWPIVPERSREEFLRRRDADFGYELTGQGRFRANIFVDKNGIGAVFRAIPDQIVPIEKLGVPQEVLRLCTLPKGLVLVTGPTGSGKSTTLASLVDYVNRTRHAHIITIEDPIEFVFENKKCLVNQREVGAHTQSFRDALRAALREDPDVILVGEMRDLETIEIALETAETGHLVFGTLHTSSAPSTIDRIVDQFPADRQSQIRVMLSESLKGVIAQMLCRRASGGRVAAFEIMFGIPAIAHLIREKKVFQIPSVMQTGQKIGMRLMNDSLLDLVKRGIITPEEALMKTQDRGSLLGAMKEARIEVQ
jgi:twitching motility protein PilT